jgi:hypothetical protein
MLNATPFGNGRGVLADRGRCLPVLRGVLMSIDDGMLPAPVANVGKEG